MAAQWFVFASGSVFCGYHSRKQTKEEKNTSQFVIVTQIVAVRTVTFAHSHL